MAWAMAGHTASQAIPFCPNRRCDSHADPASWRYRKKGFFRREARPRRIQRYACLRCKRSFSSQTFSTTYWLRRPDLQRPVFYRIGNGCSAYRQVAFELGVACETIARHAARIGRHCLLFHERIRPKGPPRETLVLDGLHSFEFGQYWPFEINVLVGVSHFVYGFQDAELRRSGRMTPYQRARWAALEHAHGRPDPKATEKSVEALLRRHLPPGSALRLETDEHKAYPRAIRRLEGRAITHATTSSRARRTKSNPLFPANRADLLIRHEEANHKRETIAFSKRRQSAMGRQWIWAVIRNYMKPTRAKANDAPPGVTVGAATRALRYEDIMRQRLMPWRPALEGWLADCYYGRIPTRRIDQPRAHTLSYAD